MTMQDMTELDPKPWVNESGWRSFTPFSFGSVFNPRPEYEQDESKYL